MATTKTTKRLFDANGVEKKEGDGPLGIAYTEDGVPVPDWSVVIEEGIEANGRRRGAKIVGAIDLKQLSKQISRHAPNWGKRYGCVTVAGVGEVGAFDLEEAKLCLTTEDFGWELGADADKAPYPPYVRLCYGELHGEQDSIRLFTGKSEIHLLKELDLRQVHYMLAGLGYVCYNSPDNLDENRFWGPGVNNCPHIVTAGLPGGKGPCFYSWYFRLPPWMPGLVLAGEPGDYQNGPLARKLKSTEIHTHMTNESNLENKLSQLKLKVLDQQEDWQRAAVVAPDYDEDKE
mmetsp:Transcript_21065/g.27308  ORF Transcript_21065/g.27308 Transcript_21065/m.27308 type:complete len:289 (+) Transcript_21065:42-908(+)